MTPNHRPGTARHTAKHTTPYGALSAAWLCCLLLVGCATPPQPPGPSLYQRLGGRPAVLALVEDAIGNIAANPRINRRFGNIDPGLLKDRLAELVCERTGGPCVYTGRNMAEAHEGMHIRDEEFDAMVGDIDKSMGKFRVPAAERAEALALLNRMRNAIVGH